MARSKFLGRTSIFVAFFMLSVGLPVPAALAQPAAAPAQPAAAAVPADPAGDVRELARKDFTLDGAPVKTPSSYQPSAARRRLRSRKRPR